jgi:hypothetical protein
MLRTLTTAAILALTLASAQAEESLASRIHAAAVQACAVESSDNLPASHYNAITESCITRLSNTATAKYQTDADLKTKASTAAFISN